MRSAAGPEFPPEEWNSTAYPLAEDSSLVRLVAAKVAESPDDIAVHLGNGDGKTYRRLWAEAGRLAHHLRTADIGVGDYVAILVENSFTSIVAVLGVLRAGAAYVPLDTRWPAARIGKPLQRLGIGWIVTAPAWLDLAEQAANSAGIRCRFVLADSTLDPWVRRSDIAEPDREVLEFLWDEVAAEPELTKAAGFNHNPGDDISAAEIDRYVEHVTALVREQGDTPRVVEIGCGAGLIARRLRAEVADYTGLDVSPVAVKRAERECGGTGNFVQALADELAHVVPAASADVVLFASTVQFFPDFGYVRKVLRSAVDSVAAGGAVVIADVVPPGEQHQHLGLAPSWFTQLGAELGLDVDIRPRAERDWSPALAARYDVVLRAGGTPGPATVTSWSELDVADIDGEVASGEDTAYVIFTSGSTGEPKGVSVCHRSAVNLIDWVNERYRIGSDDQLLWVTALTFDLSVYDLLGTLAAGAGIRIASPFEMADPEALLDILREEPITFWDSAPAALSLTMSVAEQPEGNPLLRLVFLSGDWVPLTLPDTMRAHFPQARVVALGGATEATIWSNYFDIGIVDPEWPSIPYGNPIRNARYYVLDSDRAVCPLDVEGDLYIAGTVVAQGYAGDQELTKAKFLPDTIGDPAERMYFTGDRAKWTTHGYLEFLGRRDDQVKVRGYRVELGDIQAALREIPGVVDCAMTTVTGVCGPELVAAVATGTSSSVRAEHIRAELGNRLPSYMVPEHIRVLGVLPVGDTRQGRPQGDSGHRHPDELRLPLVVRYREALLGRINLKASRAVGAEGGNGRAMSPGLSVAVM